jgi:hypothetical protein
MRLEGITHGHDQCLRPETDVSGTDDARGIGIELGSHLFFRKYQHAAQEVYANEDHQASP